MAKGFLTFGELIVDDTQLVRGLLRLCARDDLRGFLKFRSCFPPQFARSRQQSFAPGKFDVGAPRVEIDPAELDSVGGLAG